MMIGFWEQPTGRMGNVLIQYCFLRQLAVRIGTDYFHVDMPYKQYFYDFDKKNISWKRIFKRKWVVTNNEINAMGIEKFVELGRKKTEEGFDIVLKPPILGHLFAFKDENPGRFINIKEQYIPRVNMTNESIYIGVHFRGTDFKAWNEKASLNFDYYRAAIGYILTKIPKEKVVIVLFTDDNDFQPYCKMIEYLKKEGLSFIDGDANNAMISDFHRLSQCDYIVSSPSTYAIMAALTGKENKKIIHAKQWIETCVAQREEFWVDIADNKIPYYDVISVI